MSKKEWKMGQIFVAFTEYLDLNWKKIIFILSVPWKRNFAFLIVESQSWEELWGGNINMSVPFRFDLKIRGFFLKVGKTFDWDRIEIFKNIVVFFFDREQFFALVVQSIALLFLVRFIFYSLWIYFFLQARVKVNNRNSS